MQGEQLIQVPRLSQKSFEWYTPAKYINAVREVLGTIELDPASNTMANQVVQASRYYGIAQDGLTQPWQAQTLWLNPPYCKSSAGKSNQELWTCKLIAEYEAGHIEQAILLVNAATETAWFQRLYVYPICFMRGRIHFNSPTGITTGPTVGSAFVYFGSGPSQFIRVFARFGAIVQGVQTQQQQSQLWV